MSDIATQHRTGSTAATAEALNVPLIIDLDGCLIRSDLLLETALAYLSPNPLRMFQLFGWALKGRANLKRQLAHAAGLDLQLIPVNDDVVAFAESAKASGRQVYLATAADELLAIKIGTRFDFLDGVIASDGTRNLKGRHKCEELRARFPHGFDYVGDGNADLPIWQEARKVIVVEPNGGLRRAVGALKKPTETLERPQPEWQALVKACRLHQWAKNTLVFVPALLSGQIADPPVLLACTLAFFALGLVASGTYLVNDLLDLSHDRRHPSKRQRPLASGELSMHSAIIAVPALIGGGLAVGALLSLYAALALLTYLGLTLAYSLRIKREPILDTLTLAGLFTLRLVLGISVAGVVAPWLLVFSMFLFTSLSLAKRCAEIQSMAKSGATSIAGRGYLVSDEPFVLSLGLATGTGSILIMVLYLIFDAFNREFYANPHWLWGIPVVLFLWVTHIWLVGHRGKLDDDPVAYAVKDRKSLFLGSVAAGAFACAWTGVPL
jgi:4-hydroxybenzoate polyprenyltransferase